MNMGNLIPTETECEACLGAPTGQCFECFSFAQAELDDVARKRDSELKLHLKSSKEVYDSMNEAAGELYRMPTSKPSNTA
jgi:hypothetical protein